MKKEIKLGMVLSFISQVIGIVVGLLYSPIMIRILDQSEYGLYQLVQSVVNYMNLMNFGLTGAYIRYYTIAKSKGEDEIAKINGLFMRVFCILSMICLILGAILYTNIGLFGDKITEAEYGTARILLIIMVVNMAVSFPSGLFTVFINANERFIFQKAVGIVINILVPILNIPLLLWGKGSVGVVSVTLFLSLLRLAINVWYCRKKLGMQMNIRYFDRSVFLDLFRFTFFIFLSDIADQLNTNVDKFLLGRMIGTVSVAIYSVGFTLAHYYTIISWIIPEMFIPEANRVAIEEQDNDKLTKLFTKIGRYNNYICLLVLTGFVLVGREFIHLWVGEGYENAYLVCVILMASGYITSVQTLGVNIQNAKNKHKMRSLIYFVIACANVVCSIFLIRRWGEIGTALGTLFAVLLGSGLFMNWYYHRKIGLDVIYFWKHVLKWTVPAGLLCAAVWWIKQQMVIDSWLKVILFAAAYGLLYGALLWAVGIGPEERSRIRSFVKRKLGRGKAL